MPNNEDMNHPCSRVEVNKDKVRWKEFASPRGPHRGSSSSEPRHLAVHRSTSRCIVMMLEEVVGTRSLGLVG